MALSSHLDQQMLASISAKADGAAVANALKFASVEAKDAQGNTGLHLAVRDCEEYGYTSRGREILSVFLNRGLSIDVKNAMGATALHLAVQDEGYSCLHKITDLANFGANLHARDNDGRTPLHYACVQGKIDGLRQLLSLGLDVNATDEKGYTPLHVAAARGEPAVIAELLGAGANINAVTKSGKTVWDAAVDGGKDYQAQWLKAESGNIHRRAEEKARSNARHLEAQRIAAAKEAEPWSLLDANRVAFTRNDEKIGYKLTEVFNFSARTYTQIAHNLATKADAVTFRTFDEFSDKTPIEKAHAELQRLGGRAERALIGGPLLPKPPRNLKLPQPE
ncbi:MAG: ankyrin repeat domain-containing protein [Micavibrio sp.]|nr:ankyrin repeat domain-containing protein [Micavibrio sp.]